MPLPWLAVALVPGLAAPELPSGGRLEPGRTAFDELDPGGPRLAGRGPAKQFELVLAAGGPATITALSYDFDAFLRVSDEDGRLLAENDDGGFETNPRIVVELKPGRRYEVVVAAPEGRSGSFEVRAELGAVPPLIGLERDIARTGFLQQALERALDRGDEAAAGRFGLRLGDALHAGGRRREALEVLEAASLRLTETGDRRGALHAQQEIGHVRFALGDYPAALERYEVALQGLRGLGAQADEAAVLLDIGQAHERRGDHELAEERFGEALEIADLLGEPSLRAYALARLGRLDLARGRIDRAQQRLEEQLAIVQRLGDRAREARAVQDLGGVALARRDFDRALEHFERSLAVCRELGDPESEGRVLLDIGRAYVERKEIDRAREQFEQSLAIARDRTLAELEVAALHDLGTFWEDVQKFEEARRYYGEALTRARELSLASEIRQLTGLQAALLPETDPDAVRRALPELEAVLADAEEAGDIPSAAMLAAILGRLARLERSFDRAQALLEVARRHYAELGRNDAELRVQQAWLHYDRGDHARAERELRELLAEFGGGPDPGVEMPVVEALGRIHHERGEHLEAYGFFLRRLELARQLARLADEGAAHRDAGATALELGDAERALRHQTKALEILEQIGGPVERVGVRVELGRACYGLARFDEAEAHYEQALALAESERVWGGDVFALAGLAYVKLLRRDLEASLGLHEEALRRAREIGFAYQVPALLANLSTVRLDLDDPAGARSAAEEALAAAAGLPSWDPSYTLPALRTLARLAGREGRVDEGLAILDEAYERAYELRVQAIRAGLDPGPSSSEWFESLDRTYQDLAREREQRGAGQAELVEAFRKADASRARSLLSGIVELERGARSREAAARRKELEEAHGRWQELAERRRSAIRSGRPASETEALEEEARSARRHIDAIERALAEISPRDAAMIAHEGADPQSLRASALDPRTALLLFAEGEHRLYAYALGQDHLTVHDLGEREALRQRADRYVSMLGDRRRLGDAKRVAELGAELYRALCEAPLRAAGAGIERLIVVPTPALAALPFGALVVPPAQGTGEPRGFADLAFLVDRCAVSYAPAGSVLTRIAARGPRARAGKLLVLADPTYPSDAVEASAPGQARPDAAAGTRAALDPSRLPRLLRTREEAFSVAAPVLRGADPAAIEKLGELQAERSGSLAAATIDLFIGAEASRARLLAGSLRPYAWIHLAAHGYVDRESPRRTGIVLAAVPGADPGGLLTIDDVLGLELDAELVVLSACDTARGEVRDGEGVESMASAFLYAGARGVIASLWQVDDAVAAETMQAFYARVLGADRPPAAEALHQAQLGVRGRAAAGETRATHPAQSDPLAVDPAHPYFWAAFVHVGLPR